MPAGSGVSISIGEAYYPEDGSDAEELLAEADRRMYKAKQLRRRHHTTVYPQTPIEIAATA
jgi:GGDEF domain-containing protein